MLIGYGFRDKHINAAILGGINKGLRVFVIAPEGAELAIKLSADRETEVIMKRALIGASRRPLREIFCAEGAEFDKVMRFFSP